MWRNLQLPKGAWILTSAVENDKKSMGGLAVSNEAGIDSVCHESVPQYAKLLSNEQKNITLLHMLETSLENPAVVPVSYQALVTIACEHQFTRKKRSLLIIDLKVHRCTWACLIRSTDAEAAGQLVIGPESSSVPLNSIAAARKQSTRTLQRKNAVLHTSDTLESDKGFWANSWSQVESDETLTQIVREHRSQTTTAVLLRKSCSFCGRNELVNSMKIWNPHNLDISHTSPSSNPLLPSFVYITISLEFNLTFFMTANIMLVPPAPIA
ncbi:hypothetical protein C8R45DRAFT_941241 [Mycena sanguinolenta]|nr:hypothetical protein C8R45DRAFT_941241 [Mycena sanguinolenta]